MTEDLFKRAFAVGLQQRDRSRSDEGGGWVEFFRKVLSHAGDLRRVMFAGNDQAWCEFLGSHYGDDLHEQLADMRSGEQEKGTRIEPVTMLTIRIPLSVHDSLRVEATELNQSIQQLALTKLVQHVDSHQVPTFRGKPRGVRAKEKVMEIQHAK